MSRAFVKNINSVENEALRREVEELRAQLKALGAQSVPSARRGDENKAQELRYRTIFENTGTATILIESDFTICACNLQFAELVGRGRAEIEGRVKWPEFIHPLDLAAMQNYHKARRIHPDAAPKSYEFRLITHSKEIRNIILTIDMIPGSLQSVASLVDMTDRLAAERALKASEEKYRLLVETMNDGLAIQDEYGILTYVNSRAGAMLGYAPDELVGKAAIQFVAAESLAAWNRQVALRRKGDYQPYEIVWHSKLGQRIHSIVSPRALFDECRRYAGSFAILTDITALKRAAEALRLSEEMFSKAFRSSPSSTFIATLKDQRIINVNDSFVKNTGYSMFEVIGKTLSEIALFAGPLNAGQLASEVLEKGRFSQKEIEFYNKKRELRQGLISAEQIQLWKEPCLLASIEEITEARQLQRQIMRISERERHRIGRDLHDDLCPHLIGISALIKVHLQNLKSRGMDGTAPLEKVQGLIQAAVDKTRLLSHGLCPVNLLDQGLEAALKNLAGQTMALYGVKCEFTSLTSIDIQEEDAAAHIYYIVQEAVLNAVKHAGCRRIEIILKEADQRPLLMVRDDGCGIPEVRPRIGMGLKLIRFRASVIGGRLQINSRPECGTEVILLLEKNRIRRENEDAEIRD